MFNTVSMTHFGLVNSNKFVYLAQKRLRSCVLLTDRRRGFRSSNVSNGASPVRTVIHKCRLYYDSVMLIPSSELLVEDRRPRLRSSRIVGSPTAANQSQRRLRSPGSGTFFIILASNDAIGLNSRYDYLRFHETIPANVNNILRGTSDGARPIGRSAKKIA